MLINLGENGPNGNLWRDDEENIYVFEDTQGYESEYYSWFGTAGDHDGSRHTDCYPTIQQAVDALDALGRG